MPSLWTFLLRRYRKTGQADLAAAVRRIGDVEALRKRILHGWRCWAYAAYSCTVTRTWTASLQRRPSTT